MYELIQHQELSTTSSSITFTGIQSSWTDLVVKLSLRSESSGIYAFDDLGLRINGDSGNNYIARVLRSREASVATFGGSASNHILIFGASAAGATSSTFSSGDIYIPNYNSSIAKSVLHEGWTENNSTSMVQGGTVSGSWSGTAAVNSLTIFSVNGWSFVAGSSATLYGINRTSAFGKPKAIGGNITYANGYWVHTFTGSGTFYAQQDLQLEYLVVGGGGGGGSYQGGGGAGGYRAAISGELSGANSAGERPIAISARSFIPVVVGASGAGAVANGRGSNGSDSSIGSIIAFGGGGGGGRITTSSINSGASGGSGGGSGFQGSVGAGTANQGFAGGTFNNVTAEPGGGGGGAASVGGNASGSTAGNGGAGITSYATGTAVARAGGGGGGAYGTVGGVAGSGGIGGGGNGSSSSTGGAGTANTGGGGGGAGASPGNPGIGGNGGSGVVIIRYPAVEIRSAELAQPGVQYKIDPLTIQGAWTFATSENATYGGHTTDDYGNVGTIQSGTRKWTQYAGALQTARADANNSGMRLSSATNWIMSNEETVELWVHPISGGNLGRLFTWGNRQDNTCTLIDRIASTGQLIVRTNTASAATTGYALDGQWSWVVLSKRGSELRMFVNGIQVYYNSNGDGGGYTTDGRYFTLGADWDSGYIDAPRFSGAAYWQDVIAYNAAPFHSMSTIPVPTMPLTDRII